MAFNIDLHVHTMMSGDNDSEPESMVLDAIAKGLHGIAFTEHSSYRASSYVDRLRHRYSGKLLILRGVEFSCLEGHCLVYGLDTDRLGLSGASAERLLEEVKMALRKEKVPFDANIQVGVMIEIPAAVTIADLLAKEVGFFSIGTNDLIQYSLAIDRVNEHVAYLYEPLHPALIRVIKHVVDTAHAAGIKVSICGEMAGEQEYILILLALGLDQLSMNSMSIPRVKKILRSSNYHEANELLQQCFKMTTAYEIEKFVRQEMYSKYPDDFN